ncbi:MAG: GNAT family N-acetyltransferase [Gammaproteobacteria bacterium]
MMDVPDIPGFIISHTVVADAAEWAEFALRPEVTRYTSNTAQSVADIVSRIERTCSGDASTPLLFSIRDQHTRQLIASLGFHSVSASNRTAEITYTVRPERWGKGLATLTCSAAVSWGFHQRHWVRIQATTLEEHLASRRVLAKCGFEFEGKLRNFRFVSGEPRDYLLYALVAPAGERCA